MFPLLGWIKGIVFFFFPEKFVAHSLTRFWEILFFFFFRHREKKKNNCFFFFFWEKFTCHSLDKKNYVSKKRSKKGKICSFSIFDSVFFVFFSFPKNLEKFFFFFFYGKVYTPLTHSISKPVKKKKQGRKKKKTAFLLTDSIFAKKWSKSNFSREKKIRYLCSKWFLEIFCKFVFAIFL